MQIDKLSYRFHMRILFVNKHCDDQELVKLYLEYLNVVRIFRIRSCHIL